MNTCIINYGLGNIFSLKNAFAFCGSDPDIENDPDKIMKYDSLILPGVGAFGDGMNHLREKGLDEAVKNFAKTGKPIIGICLGMHMLMDTSEELGTHEGLGLIPGKVRYFTNVTAFDKSEKIPNISWSEVKTKTSTCLLENINPPVDMYFVHSLCVQTKHEENSIAVSNYGGIEFSSIIQKDNIIGCQFHPEKSAVAGLKLIENFLKI